MRNIDTLKQLLVARSVRTGSFTLASGKSSNIYIDARLTTLSPEGMILIGSIGLSRIGVQGWRPDSIGGLTMGADPIAFAIARTSADGSNPLRAFTVRKEPKFHGAANLIEGPFRPTDNVVIIEDVITTGKSAIRAIDAIENAGGRVLGVLTLVDREDGGREAIQARGHGVISLTTITELIGRVADL